MKFTKIKQNILKNKFDKSLSRRKGNRNVSQKEIHTIGILTTEEISSKINLPNEVEKIFNIKNVKIYSFRKFNKTDEATFKHFSDNDLNWKGEFTDTSFQGFLDQPFDLLIGFFNAKNVYIEKAVLDSKATFKAGFSDVNSQLFEIEIAESITNVSPYLLELKKYLQILKKIKN